MLQHTRGELASGIAADQKREADGEKKLQPFGADAEGLLARQRQGFEELGRPVDHNQ